MQYEIKLSHLYQEKLARFLRWAKGPIGPSSTLGIIGVIDATIFHEWCVENNIMDINLYPDMSRSQYTGNDTFIYAAPVTTEVWNTLQKFARRTPDRVGYMIPGDLGGLEDVIILRTPQMTDDECLEAAAYIRMVDNRRERAYCVPCRAKLSHYDIINRTSGAPKALCKMVTLDGYEQEAKENQDPQTV